MSWRKPPASRLIDKLPAALDVPVDMIKHAVEEFASDICRGVPKKRLGAPRLQTDTAIILTANRQRRAAPLCGRPHRGGSFVSG